MGTGAARFARDENCCRTLALDELTQGRRTDRLLQATFDNLLRSIPRRRSLRLQAPHQPPFGKREMEFPGTERNRLLYHAVLHWLQADSCEFSYESLARDSEREPLSVALGKYIVWKGVWS